MLNDATCFKKIFIVTGYTDLRSGIDRLADTIRSYLGEDAIEADTLSRGRYGSCERKPYSHTDEKKDKKDSPEVLSSAIIKIVLETNHL